MRFLCLFLFAASALAFVPAKFESRRDLLKWHRSLKMQRRGRVASIFQRATDPNGEIALTTSDYNTTADTGTFYQGQVAPANSYSPTCASLYPAVLTSGADLGCTYGSGASQITCNYGQNSTAASDNPTVCATNSLSRTDQVNCYVSCPASHVVNGATYTLSFDDADSIVVSVNTAQQDYENTDCLYRKQGDPDTYGTCQYYTATGGLGGYGGSPGNGFGPGVCLPLQTKSTGAQCVGIKTGPAGPQ